ncbi:MAG: MoaD/ThiS family protein [Acetobacteraceae bacterium]
MPRVVFAGAELPRLAGGASELEVAAKTFRQLVRELDARFPGLGTRIEEGMAIAIDGVIYQDAYAAPLTDGAEIVLIPKIGGG